MIKLRNISIDNLAANYLPSPSLERALEVAYMLKRPLLLTGEPGTGKTQFAHWVANQLAASDGFQSLPYIYNTKTSSTAQDLFYNYDAVTHFRDKDSSKTAANFIQLKALGLALANAIGRQDLQLNPTILDNSDISPTGRGSVVLIDEIDKAPRDFPNDLLNEIENYEFEIKEINQKIKLTHDDQKQKVVVILTSNFEKNLPDAFLRRCIYYHIDFPTPQRLYDIILRRLDISSGDFRNIEKRVHDFFLLYQYPNISKRPSTSEFIDFIRVLKEDGVLDKDFFVDGRPQIDEVSARYIPILLKNKDDIARFLAKQ